MCAQLRRVTETPNHSNYPLIDHEGSLLPDSFVAFVGPFWRLQRDLHTFSPELNQRLFGLLLPPDRKIPTFHFVSFGYWLIVSTSLLMYSYACVPQSTVWLIDSISCNIIQPLGWNSAGGNMGSAWQQSRQRTVVSAWQVYCFLHNEPILMGRRLTVVSQWEVLSITGRNLHSGISDHQTWRLDIVVARRGFCLQVKQVVLESGCQNTPKALCLHRKLQLSKSEFRCLRGNDSKDVTMGYVCYYLTPFTCSTVWGGLYAWCLQMYEVLAQVRDHPETAQTLVLQLFHSVCV